MQIKPCRSYHARLLKSAHVRMPDGRSVFKVYFIDIINRPERARYEWEFSPVSQNQFLEVFARSGLEGVGFVTAFPHIVKVFCFAPDMETVLHVKACGAADMAPLDLARAGGYCEFACYAEAALAAAEYAAWARARTVPEYLEFKGELPDGLIVDHGKLGAYFGGRRAGEQ